MDANAKSQREVSGGGGGMVRDRDLLRVSDAQADKSRCQGGRGLPRWAQRPRIRLPEKASWREPGMEAQSYPGRRLRQLWGWGCPWGGH